MNPKDFPEDAVHENGNYENKCVVCGSHFIGLKRRVLCKECYQRPPVTFSQRIAELEEAVRVLAHDRVHGIADMIGAAVINNHTARAAVEKARKG